MLEGGLCDLFDLRAIGDIGGDSDRLPALFIQTLRDLLKRFTAPSRQHDFGTPLGGSFDAVLDKAKAALFMGTDRPHVLRQAINCCRKAGTVSVPGVYIGFLDKMPMGAFVNKGLTMKSGQTHVHRYLPPLMAKITEGAIDPSFVITHRLPLSEAAEAYKTFRDKKDGCIKVVLKP